jgi:hypothetical protein
MRVLYNGSSLPVSIRNNDYYSPWLRTPINEIHLLYKFVFVLK